METKELDWRAAIKVLRQHRNKLARKTLRGNRNIKLAHVLPPYQLELAMLKTYFKHIEGSFKMLEKQVDRWEVIEGKVYEVTDAKKIQNKLAGRNRLGGS